MIASVTMAISDNMGRVVLLKGNVRWIAPRIGNAKGEIACASTIVFWGEALVPYKNKEIENERCSDNHTHRG